MRLHYRPAALHPAAVALFLSSAGVAAPSYLARYEDDGAGRRRLVSPVAAEPGLDVAIDTPMRERSYPQFVAEHAPLSATRIVELRSADADELIAVLAERQVAAAPPAEEGLDEVVTLVESGPSANRVDLVFMGDGYTAAERALFFGDIQRIVQDMFSGDTFRSYLPLFNVYAVFRPSNESGIGKSDRMKDTAYGLYREGDTLRAIYPGRPAAARASCAAAPGCDYPVIIGNDPYYGGLGGEFAISTSSPTSGTVVLRHELGHNFGRVGEEYDGGGYFGANNSRSLDGLTWRHWASDATVTAEPVVARFLAWPWHNLSSGPYTAPFTSDGRHDRAAIRFSASGILTDDTMRLSLDGAPLAFSSPGSDDRGFHNIRFAEGFAAGRHELRFDELLHDGNNWVSSLTIHEFGADYHFADDFVGAFPVFNRDGSVAGYRSNHELCLMRNMQSRHFCSVCQENNWLEFFSKVKLIDDLVATRDGGQVQVTLTTQRLGQLARPADPASRVTIVWRRDGAEVPSLHDLATWSLPARDAAGRWEVEVGFESPEIRSDPTGLTRDRRTINL